MGGVASAIPGRRPHRSVPMVFVPAWRVVASLIVYLSSMSAATSAAAQARCATSNPTDLRLYVGRFGKEGPASESVIVVAVRDGDLTMRPLLWSGLAHLERVGVDSFQAVQYRRPGARFRRDASGCVIGLDLLGTSPGGFHRLLADGERWPIEELVRGRSREAARAFHRIDTTSTDRLIGIAERVATMPSRAGFAADFLSELVQLRPGDARAYVALGNALVAAGRRPEAAPAFRRALTIDANNADALAALRRMTPSVAATDSGWVLPFTLASLFSRPTPAEVEATRRAWADRDLAPRDVEVIARHDVSLDGVAAEARVVRHRVLGSNHIGVIVVPRSAGRGCCPILVEAKGVSPSFPPLDVPAGLTSPFVLGPRRGDVIYVVPGFRGEWVRVGGDSVLSEGDRSDAWDGATDDVIALLRVAKQITPEADTSRVCAFGRSRGGAVALLSGIREASIDCVVSWAAPTEWLQLMGTAGWTQQELVADGLRSRSSPGQVGGQFINYFLGQAIEGRQDLNTARRHIIASSAIHFADRIPLTQAHWSEDDPSVPVINGRAFVDRVRAARHASCLDVRFHPEAGHDQDRQRAPRESREFLVRALFLPDSMVTACRRNARK